MSNTVTLISTDFINLIDGETCHGFRIYDDHDAAYCDSLPEEYTKTSDKDLLRLAAHDYSDDSITGMVDFALEHGMLINDTWYSSEEVAGMLAEGVVDHG